MALPEALRDALGQVIANERREWRREREAIQSEARAAIAELRASLAEERAISAALQSEPSATGRLKAIADAAASATARAEASIADRLSRVKDGKSVTPRGTWAETETYRELDIVAMNGASWIARRDDPGPCPGDGWQLLCSAGKRGRGAAVTKATLNAAGMLTLSNGDGATIQVDLAPLRAPARAGSL